MRKYSAEEIALMSQYHITQHQFNYIDDQLQNNHDISDHDLKIDWLASDIEESIVSAALKLRPQFLTDPFCELGIDKNGLKAANSRKRITQH